MIERKDEGVCGRALIGALAGSIHLDGDQRCRIEAVFAHELGHAFGFWHVDGVGSLMYPYDVFANSAADAPTETERYHMALMYARPRGNRDVDVDP
jgi:hypothetical protein